MRNAMFRRVQLAAADDPDGLAALEDEPTFTGDDWDAALGDYYDEHDEIGTAASARAPGLLVIEDRSTRLWRVRQIIDDPQGNHDWQISAEVDLDASDEQGELVLRVVAFARLD